MASPLDGSLAKTIHSAFKTLFLDATLTRDGANSGDAYDPETAAPTVYPCKAICEPKKGTSGTDMAGTSDMAFLILANSLPSGISPEPLDRIAIASQGLSGVVANDPNAVKSDPARAAFECRVVT